MPLITRTDKGSPLSIAEMDGNLDYCSPGTYVEVDISSAEILAMGTTPIELLPAPGVGKYYEYKGSIEYTRGTAGYQFNSSQDLLAILIESQYAGTFIQPLFLTGIDTPIISFFNNTSPQGLAPNGLEIENVYTDTNSRVVMTTFSGVDLTLGDGTMKAKIWYKLRTVG